MNDDVQGLVTGESLGDVPFAVILAGIAPAVLHDIVFVADLILSGAIDQHAVVIACLVVVVCDLALLLGDPFLRRRLVHGFFLAVGGAHAQPVGHIAALQILFLGVKVGKHSHTGHLATEPTLLADVGTPSNRVSLINGIVHHLHQFVDGEVPSLAPAPVVLHFDDEGLIEGMVRE